MMKKYSKPEVYFENYSLLGSIASACKYVINAVDISTCSADIPEIGKVFTSMVGDCEITGIDDKTCAAGGAVDVLGLSGS